MSVDERKAALPEWAKGSRDSVDRLATLLDAPPPEGDRERLLALVPRLETMLRDQDFTRLDEDERRWLAAQLLSFVGELLIAEHGGRWLVDDEPGSQTYGRYVVGGFSGGDLTPVVDPSSVVTAVFAQAPPRSLVAAIGEVEVGM